MTPSEWLVLCVVGVRVALVRPQRGLTAEALADALLVLPCFLLQDARIFPREGWKLLLPGGVPALAIVYGVALLGAAITLADYIRGAFRGTRARGESPWGIAFIDLILLAGLAGLFEWLFFRAGAWTYRFAGPFGNVPAVGIPWAVLIGAGGFGFFFSPTIREYRRWTADALGRLAVFGHTVLGVARPETGPVRWARGGTGPGLWRVMGVAVLRLLDL